MDRIKVFLVDDQILMLDGLKTILSLHEVIDVVGTATDGQQALAMIEETRPDVVLMDIRMPIMDGVECTRRIMEKYRDMHVVILTTFDDDEFIIQALSHGASGYLLKDIDGEKLIQAIHDVLGGNLLLPSQNAQAPAGRCSLPQTSPPA